MLQPTLHCSAQSPFFVKPYVSDSRFFNYSVPLPAANMFHTGSFTPKSKLCVVVCRQSDYQSPFTASRPTLPSDRPPSIPPGVSGRVYVSHSIYKGKAALTVEPRGPEFSMLDSGAFKVAKEGFMYLQFAPASGVRQYEWSRKQVFSLSVAEIGSLITLGPRESLELFHDPNKGRSDEGKVRKVLKVEPLPDGSGHFFNLSVQNKLIDVDESIYIPVTKGEFAILVSIFNYVLPYLLGWNTFANSVKPDDSGPTNSANSRIGADYEWNR